MIWKDPVPSDVSPVVTPPVFVAQVFVLPLVITQVFVAHVPTDHVPTSSACPANASKAILHTAINPSVFLYDIVFVYNIKLIPREDVCENITNMERVST